MDFHPLATSIVCTLKDDLLFSSKDEEGIDEAIISVQMPMPAITFTEMPGPHYRGIVWAHFSRLGSTWAMHMSIGVPHRSTSLQPIAILRMEFLEDSSQTDGVFMMECDLYTDEDWDEIKSGELEHWIEQGLDMDIAYEDALSENDTDAD